MNALKRLLYSQRQDQPALAVVVILVGLLALSLQDALGKILSSYLSLWQFQTTRAVFNICAVLLIARFTMGAMPLTPINPRIVFIRSVLHVCALMFFFGSAPFLTMAEMAGGLYTFPLFVALLSALVLGERVGVRRISAIVLGFIGTLLILRLGTSSFRPFNLMPVVAGFFYANFIIVTRRYCRDESPVVLTFVSNVTILFVGSLGLLTVYLLNPADDLKQAYPFLLSSWRSMTFWALGLLVICTVFNVIGNIFMSKAYQSAESSFLAPFDYSYLIFAAIWGYVFWRDIPSPPTLAGMVLIAGSGIFVAVREARLNREVEAT